MKFVRNTADSSIVEDSVYGVMELANKRAAEIGEENVYNATIGSLYGENDIIVAFDTVYNSYHQIPKEKKAAYSGSIAGNPNYLSDVYRWIFEDKKLNLFHKEIATAGGSGALALAFKNILDIGETVLLPEIAWGCYYGMVKENNNNMAFYELFEGDHFNIASFKQACLKVLETQNKLLVLINDPCHNPTGYSLTMEEWTEIIEFLNICAKENAVFLLNDVAYIDYSYSQSHARDYLSVFNHIEHNFVVYIAFSCSKSLTSYGLRCGAGILLGKDEETLNSIQQVFIKTARAIWSSVPNAAMENFSLIANKYKEDFLVEKKQYIDLMKERSSLFIEEAKQCDLPIYPYKEGFFVTIKIEDSTSRDRFHEQLLAHDIFSVKVTKGIRLAICSLSLRKIKGLAAKMKSLL